MRLLRFDAGRGPEVGMLPTGDIDPIARRLPGLPSDLRDVIAGWAEWRPRIEALRDPGEGEGAPLALDGVRLLPPVARPGKILGIGLNYADHVAESGMSRPTEQLWFMKGVTAIGGPADPIPLPRVSEQLDYERNSSW